MSPSSVSCNHYLVVNKMERTSSIYLYLALSLYTEFSLSLSLWNGERENCVVGMSTHGWMMSVLDIGVHAVAAVSYSGEGR